MVSVADGGKERAQMAEIDESLSRAVVVWTGKGVSAWPSRSEERLVEAFGEDAALDLVPRVKALKDSFFMSEAKWTAPDLVTMGNQAAAEFREIHPEISEEAVQDLAWCYTYAYK